MKKISLIVLLAFLCSLPGYSQFWINFGWNEPHCRSCGWMESSLRLSNRQANEYHKIIHKYGQKIEKEARRDYIHWDKAARKIYNLRMERDRKLQRILNPAQFSMYVRFVREEPKRIHDYRGWYKNPRYSHVRPSFSCTHYEDNYWTFRWEPSHNDHNDYRHQDDASRSRRPDGYRKYPGGRR